jgi:DNA-binding Lrp family transcriptional regulator
MLARTARGCTARAQEAWPDWPDDPQVLLAWILLDGHRREDLLRFEGALAGMAELQTALLVGGEFDYLLVFATPDLDGFQSALDRLLARDLNVARVATTLVLGSVAGRGLPPFWPPAGGNRTEWAGTGTATTQG